ncbi:hypothetical protein [Flavobacterium sp.]|jgi:hypothetical protein|uniref:hypothetical protein n=1 Tax=Flavobacterium sp. TaxID=239 RepID=UPI002A823C94|nr:hypothetical protein [Flavobacterium sp.]
MKLNNEINNKIEDQIKNGYDLDLGIIIDKSLAIYKKVVWKAGLGYILVFGIVMIIGLILAMTIQDETLLEQFKEISQDPNFLYKNPTLLAYLLIGGLIINMIFIPLNAGFFNLCHLANTNQEFTTLNIFDFYTSRYLKNLVIGSLLIAVVTTSLTTVLDMVNLKIVSFIIQISFTLFTILFVPLVIYANQSIGNAIKKSIQLVMKSPFTILGALIIGILFLLAGLLGLCIGILFTIPFISCIQYTVYESIVGFENETTETTN